MLWARAKKTGKIFEQRNKKLGEILGRVLKGWGNLVGKNLSHFSPTKTLVSKKFLFKIKKNFSELSFSYSGVPLSRTFIGPSGVTP